MERKLELNQGNHAPAPNTATWELRANKSTVASVFLSLLSLAGSAIAYFAAEDAAGIARQALQLAEPTVVPSGYSIAATWVRADNAIGLEPTQSNDGKAKELVRLIPPTLTNAGTVTAKNITLTWIPTYIKAQIAPPDPAFWKVTDNSNAKPLSLGPGAKADLPSIPATFDSQQADKIEYAYGVLEISYSDARASRPAEYYAYEMNAVSGQLLYILITKPSDIKAPVEGMPYPRYFINPQAVANPAYGDVSPPKVEN